VAAPTGRDLRDARVAHVLARAVRKGEVEAVDALRILRHELRRRNTNSTPRIKLRSVSAQASIDKYAPQRPPTNDSDDALHADHVYPLSAELLHRSTRSRGGWQSLRGSVRWCASPRSRTTRSNGSNLRAPLARRVRADWHPVHDAARLVDASARGLHDAAQLAH
jgi:hypothetical protein